MGFLRSAYVFAALLVGGCSSGLSVVKKLPPGPPAITTVFVYPVQLTGVDAPSWRQNELAQRALDVALRHESERFAFYGPTEFQVSRPSDDGAWVTSSALPLLVASGSRPEQGVVLRLVVERRRTHATNEAADAKGRRKGAALEEETTWLARAEVLHPSTSQVLIEVSGQVHVDPFADPEPDDDFDEATPMTRLLEKLTRRALKELRPLAADRASVPMPDLRLALTPASLVGFRADDPSGLIAVARLDAAQAELFLQNRARMLTPSLSDAQVQKLAHERTGMLVIGSAGTPFLSPGDFVETIDGKPAQPQALHRARWTEGGVTIRVRRPDGQAFDLPFP